MMPKKFVGTQETNQLMFHAFHQINIQAYKINYVITNLILSDIPG
jgi:hypothetical protein